VTEVYVRLYEKGLIYKGNYMVNFCPGCHTVISDIEVDYQEDPSHLWYIRYPIEGSDQFLEVATTRPETMLGDTAVAVNPVDPRYAGMQGKHAILPLVGRRLPIICDDHVDPAFGTGAVKVTPAHDPNDFEMGQTHDLEFVSVIDTHGKMINAASIPAWTGWTAGPPSSKTYRSRATSLRSKTTSTRWGTAPVRFNHRAIDLRAMDVKMKPGRAGDQSRPKTATSRSCPKGSQKST
jgi:valyl-tRNA synthetase